MTEPLDDRPAHRSLRRDADVRAVSRVTRGVAVAAIAGTVVVAGLAAGGVGAQSGSGTALASDGGPAAAALSPAAENGAYADPANQRYDDGDRDWDEDARISPDGGGLQAPSSPPAGSLQPPAASSGGS